MIHGWHSSGVRASRKKKKKQLQAAVYLLEVKLGVGRKLFALVRRGGSSKLDLLQDFMSDTDLHCLEKSAGAGLGAI